MSNKKNKISFTERVKTKTAPAVAKLQQFGKWAYNYPYGYARLLLLAGLAGMFVYEFVREHVTINGIDAVAGVVAVIVIAHLLGGLKALKN
jgi:hypothetical protein